MMVEDSDKKTNKKKTTKKTEKIVSFIKIDDLEGKFLHVRVGTDSMPANSNQIKDIQDKIIDLFDKNNINCVAFVTHHAVSMDIIEKAKVEE